MPPRVNFRLNLVKVEENHRIAQVWCWSKKNIILGWFWPNFDFLSTRSWLGAFWLIWPEMALWVLRCPNRLCHITVDVSVALWRKDNIFGIFGVWHANRRWTKYGVYSYTFFIWHLECNERCWIKNVIPHFFALKLCGNCTVHGSRLVLPDIVKLQQLIRKTFPWH